MESLGHFCLMLIIKNKRYGAVLGKYMQGHDHVKS